MADDPDLSELRSAFAALERSGKRFEALIEKNVETVIGTGATPPIAELIASLERGEPLTDEERRTVMDYLNGLALGVQESDKHGTQADQSDE